MSEQQFGAWFDTLSEREQKEIRFCLRCEHATYEVREYRRATIVELATLLNRPPATAWRDAMVRYHYQIVALAEEYARDYRHGTDGHDGFLLIAKLAGILDEQEKGHDLAVSRLLVEVMPRDGLAETTRTLRDLYNFYQPADNHNDELITQVTGLPDEQEKDREQTPGA